MYDIILFLYKHPKIILEMNNYSDSLRICNRLDEQLSS